MKIGYFADGPWPHQAFHYLLNDSNLDVQFVVPRKNSRDNVLKTIAEANNIDYLEGVSVNSLQFYQLAQAYECDLFVSMSYDQIFKEEILNLPQLGTINCHAGKLPFYRGRNILNWVLINDEKDFDITVHYLDATNDTEDIILQKTYPITDDDNYSTLLELAYKECAHVLYEALVLIKCGNVNSINQKSIHPTGTYFGARKKGDEIINWNQSSREVFNFIRAVCSPGPVARTYCNGNEVHINKAALVKNAPAYRCINGMVVGQTVNGYYIKTNDTFLEILEVESGDKLKIRDRLISSV